MPSRARNFFFAACAAMSAVHCNPRDPAATTLLAGPGGIAIAGPKRDRAFIANRGTDSIAVLQLRDTLADTDFVPSKARYFPVQLPVGPEPTEVAAAADGQFVFVLDALSGEVSAIDATNLRVVPGADGARLRVAVGDVSAQARSLVGDNGSCQAGVQPERGACVARAYVALKAMGSVVEVQLRADPNGQYAMVLEQSVVVGGEPEAIAMGDGDALFVTDDASPTLVRLPLPLSAAAQGNLARFALGGVGGAVAATARAVAVTRPATGDVVVLTAAPGRSESASTADLVVRDADPTFAPLPKCLLPCDAESDACLHAHPADQALCLGPGGYEQPQGATPYGALSVRGHPQALAAMDPTAIGSFNAHCVGGSTTAVYAGGFAVASVNGAVELIGLADDGTPTLIDIGFCQPPTLAQLDGAQVDLQSILGPCPTAPARRRFACASAQSTDDAVAAGPAGAPPGVLVMRGNTGEKIGLLWEGVLPNGDGSDRQAFIDEAGIVRRRSRDGRDFAAVTTLRPREVDAVDDVVHLGDVFEVVSSPTPTDACKAQLAGRSSERCAFERRVVALVDANSTTGPSGIVLDSPLPRACFDAGIAYRLRAGDTFLAGRLLPTGQIADDTLARVSPGDRYGPAETGATTLAVSFAVRDDLQVDAGLSACERYGTEGRAKTAALAWRNRVGYSAAQVRDPAASLQLAAAYDGAGRMVRQLGFMPHALAFTPPASPGGVRLIVSFAGSNAVYLTEISGSRDLFGEAHQRKSRLLTN